MKQDKDRTWHEDPIHYMITRRNFLKTITTAAGLILLDPSVLIEQVGTTFYSFPPAPVWGKGIAEIMADNYNRMLIDLRRDMNRQMFGDGFHPKILGGINVTI